MSLQDAKLLLTPNAYKASKLYAIKPIDGSGDATVTRNTTKTRVNSSGLIESLPANVLAPDYLNGVCPALNVEGQATNSIKQSENLLGTEWDSIEATVTSFSNIIGLPFFKIENTTSGGRIFQQNIILNSGQNYNLSCFVDTSNTTSGFIALRVPSEDLIVSLDIANKTITTNGSPLINSKVKDYGNNIYRVSFSFLSTTATSSTVFLYSTKEGNGSLIGTVGEFSIATGFQLQKGTEASSYIPNSTTATITKSADTVTVPIPAGTTKIIEKYEDGTTNTITTIPASPYTVPRGKRYEYILMR